MFEERQLWKELFYLWLTGPLFTRHVISLQSSDDTWEAVLSQTTDLPVGDGEVADLLLPPAHQPPHGVEGQDGGLAGDQLQAGDQEDQQQHLHPSLVRGTRSYQL